MVVFFHTLKLLGSVYVFRSKVLAEFALSMMITSYPCLSSIDNADNSVLRPHKYSCIYTHTLVIPFQDGPSTITHSDIVLSLLSHSRACQ